MMQTQEQDTVPAPTLHRSVTSMREDPYVQVARNHVDWGLRIGVWANALNLLVAWCFYADASQYPRGSGLIPAALSVIIFYIAPAGFFIGLPLSISGVNKLRRSGDKRGLILGIVGAVINTLPYFIGWPLIYLITEHLGLHWIEH